MNWIRVFECVDQILWDCGVTNFHWLAPLLIWLFCYQTFLYYFLITAKRFISFFSMLLFAQPLDVTLVRQAMCITCL